MNAEFIIVFMQKSFFIVVLLALFSCNDGDFEIPSFEFDTNVNLCGTYVLHRENSEKTEALILLLNPTDILQEAGNRQIPITSENVFYRIFDESVGADYFCATVPPAQPVVIREWTAVAGNDNFIDIETTAIIHEDGVSITGYKHTLVLYYLILESNNEKITHETYHFGSFDISFEI